MKSLVVAGLSLALLVVPATQVAAAARLLIPRQLVGSLVSPTTGPSSAFDRQHPVRGAFGDPRLVSDRHPFGWTGPGQVGAHSFHNGIDIVASPGTPVYPVVSGRVVRAKPDEIVVDTDDGRSFQYYHLSQRPSRVQVGKLVVARAHGPRLDPRAVRPSPSRRDRRRRHPQSARPGSSRALPRLDETGRHRPLRQRRPAAEPARWPFDRTRGRAGGLRCRAADHSRARPVGRSSASSRPGRMAAVPWKEVQTRWKSRRRLPEDRASTAVLLAGLRRRHLPELSRLRPNHLAISAWPAATSSASTSIRAVCSPGLHRIAVRVADVRGNRSTTWWPLQIVR